MIFSHRLSRGSMAIDCAAGAARHHSTETEPDPAPTSHNSSRARGARAASVSARIGDLVIWLSWAKSPSGRTLGKPLFAPPDTAIGLSLDATPLARRVIRPEKASPPGIPAALVRETHRAVATRAGVLRRTTDRPRLDTTVPTRPTFHAMAHIRVVASANFVTGRHATRGRFETTGVRWEDEQSKRVRCAWRCGAATRRRTS